MSDGKESKWGWMRQLMPQTMQRLAEKRSEVGADWLADCWQRGVIQREPGVFVAAEGALIVGVPSGAHDLELLMRYRARFPDGVYLQIQIKPEGWTRGGR